MADVFSKQKRSVVMALIRSRGNRDTEVEMARLLRMYGITGWRRHVPVRIAVLGLRNRTVRPDFVFLQSRVAVFVDGCFWHGCPKHSPPARWLRKSSMPARAEIGRSGKRFWREKLAANQARDRAVNRALRRAGWLVVRVWEHELSKKNSARVARRISKAVRLTPNSRCHEHN